MSFNEYMKGYFSFLQIRILWEFVYKQDIPGNVSYRDLANTLLEHLGEDRMQRMMDRIPNNPDTRLETVIEDLRLERDR